MIRLKSEEIFFELTLLSATKSGLLKNIIEDCGTDEVIPLENISPQTLTKVIQYLNQNLSDNTFNQKVESNDIKKYVSLWEAEFIDVEIFFLKEIILAANFLDIPQLLKLCSIKFCSILYGKSSEEMRKILNEENDLDPAEVLRIRQKYEDDLKL